MNFSQAKNKIVEAILAGDYLAESRSETGKNLLEDKELSDLDAAAIVSKTRGSQAKKSSHHQVSAIDVWVFRPDGWYVKFYFTSSNVIISFHRSEK